MDSEDVARRPGRGTSVRRSRRRRRPARRPAPSRRRRRRARVDPVAAHVVAGAGAPRRRAPAPARPRHRRGPTPDGSTCPTCGRRNDAHLHFCARCGHVLREEPPAPAASQGTAWRRMMEDRDRSAAPGVPAEPATAVPLAPRRDRRARPRCSCSAASSPSVGTRCAGCRTAGGTCEARPSRSRASPRRPARRTRRRPAPTRRRLLDGTEQAWSEPWNPETEGDSCGGAPGTGSVVLTMPAATRVREIDLNAGLPASNAKRPLELVPQAIGVRFDSGSVPPLHAAEHGRPAAARGGQPGARQHGVHRGGHDLPGPQRRGARAQHHRGRAAVEAVMTARAASRGTRCRAPSATFAQSASAAAWVS